MEPSAPPAASAHAAGVPFVDLRPQVAALLPELRAAFESVFSSCDFVLGAAVAAFERDFAAYCGVAHAVGVSSGLDALRLALSALGVGPGDEVVVPASTYAATALAVASLGASVRLVDCEAGTGNLDARAVAAALGARTRAVIAVHLGGQPADVDAVLAACAARSVPVVEDAAHAHGASYRGRRAGALARAGCFSFYPGKNLGAFGDAGCVTTDDPALAARLRSLRDYGQRAKYDHAEKGVNARLDTVQAAWLRVKLPRLDEWNRHRARLAARYRERLAGVGDLAFQAAQPGAVSSDHLFMVESARRDALAAALAAAGVETRMHYPKAVHRQAAFADLGLGEGAFPNAERRAARTLSLPLYPELTDAQHERVCAAVRGFFGA